MNSKLAKLLFYLTYRILLITGIYKHEFVPRPMTFKEWCSIEYKGPTVLEYWSNKEYWDAWVKREGWNDSEDPDAEL